MKEKIRLRGWCYDTHGHCIELTPSELASQLREQGWTLDNDWNPPKQECEHEWEFYCSSTGNANPDLVQTTYHCRKCGEYKTEDKPTQKPKIEELQVIISKGFYDSELMNYIVKPIVDKINELIKAVNGLYER